MALGAAGVLGIEIGSNQIRLVHGAVSGGVLKIYDFAAEEVLISNPENVPQQLASLVERRKLGAYPVGLVLSGPGVVHRLLEFPSMPLSELAAVVEREIHLIGQAGHEEVVFDWEAIEEKDTAKVKETRVLAAIAPKSQVEQAQELLARCKLKPAIFTTPPIALLRSLRFVQGEETGSRTVLCTVGQQGYLLGVKDGVWSFYREFSSRGGETGADALVEEAVREANRALLYHRQRYREAGEMTFLVSGERALDALQLRLEREMGVHGEIARPGRALDLTPLRERAGIFRDLFPAFLIPLGMVAAACLPAGINLVPKGARKQVRSRPAIDLSFIRRPWLALAFLLVLFGVHLGLVLTERHYRGMLAQRTALYAQWAPVIQASEESRELRENESLLTQALGRGRARGVPWVVLFKAISRLAPSDLLLSSMTVQWDKDKGTWLVTLKGQVESPDSYVAQAAFNRFYQGLKGSPHFERVELLPLNVSTFSEKLEAQPSKESPGQGPSQNREAGAVINKTKVQFELKAQPRGI